MNYIGSKLHVDFLFLAIDIGVTQARLDGNYPSHLRVQVEVNEGNQLKQELQQHFQYQIEGLLIPGL